MASNYGLNFGFRRSDESMTSGREGRLRTPAEGTFRIGSLVAFDAANPGYLRAATANEIGEGGTVGLLVQEEQMFGSIYEQEVANYDSFSLGLAKNNTLSAIWAGAGLKVWFKNTESQTRADGRSITGVTMVDLAAVGINDYLKWDGSKFVKGTNASDSMLRVTNVNAEGGYCEAVLVR